MRYRSPVRLYFLRLFPSLLLLFAAACESPASTGGFLDPERWVSELDLRVGSIDDPDYALTWFRTLAVSESGRIYTAHGQEQVVRAFEPDGSLFRIIGGRGEGPGEFQNVAQIGWVADTLWVLDYSLYRFNLFSEDGEFLHSFSVPFKFREDETQPYPPRAAGLLSDGTVHGGPPVPSHEVEDGTITHQIILLMTRDGEVTDSVASIRVGNNQWAVYDPDNRMSGMMFTQQPFGDGPRWGFVPNERALAVLYRKAPSTLGEARFRLIKQTLSGDTVFAREYSYQPDPLMKEETDSILDFNVTRWAELGIMGGATAARLGSWAERGLFTPPFRPPISEMVIGRKGGFWLRGNPIDGDSVMWFVLDPDGSPAGQVSLPVGLRVLAADPSAVWGTETDDLDVSYLVRYRIIRH